MRRRPPGRHRRPRVPVAAVLGGAAGSAVVAVLVGAAIGPGGVGGDEAGHDRRERAELLVAPPETGTGSAGRDAPGTGRPSPTGEGAPEDLSDGGPSSDATAAAATGQTGAEPTPTAGEPTQQGKQKGKPDSPGRPSDKPHPSKN